MKRFLDFSISLVLLILLAPVFGLVALAVKLLSPGPVFFRHTRSGFRGAPFEVLKFRTMVVDHSEVLAPDFIQSMHSQGVVVKMEGDPRVTPLGRMLRRTSLDELPQLVNVLKGEMSLVGPRPLPAFQLIGCSAHLRRREAVKPGITGMWQICAREKNTKLSDMLPFDIYYVRHQSFWLDLKILAGTIPAVLKTTGAV